MKSNKNLKGQRVTGIDICSGIEFVTNGIIVTNFLDPDGVVHDQIIFTELVDLTTALTDSINALVGSQEVENDNTH